MIDQYPPANGVLTSLIWRKTAAGGETSLSGYDNASQALSYTPGQEQVYLNGILLVRGSDYTATNGTSITGLAALAADDFVQINCYNNFSVASLPSTSITGEITNSQITSLATSKLTGTIANNQLANSAITINGNAISLGGSVSLPGDIESVTAGTGLSGGGNSGAVTLTNTVATTFDAAGDLVYGTGSDTFTKLSLGTAGQVLKVNSGATAPEWGTAAGGGNKTYTLLNTGGTAMTGSTTITVNVTTKEDYYILVMAADSGSRFAMDFRINGDTGANYAFTSIRWDIDGASYSPAHYFSNSSTGLTSINMGTSSTGGSSTVSAGIYVGAGNSTTLHPVTYQTGGTASGGNSHDLITGTAMYNGSAAITSFSFIAATNFTGGIIYVYGA